MQSKNVYITRETAHFDLTDSREYLDAPKLRTKEGKLLPVWSPPCPLTTWLCGGPSGSELDIADQIELRIIGAFCLL
jgi:hypothetical protein